MKYSVSKLKLPACVALTVNERILEYVLSSVHNKLWSSLRPTTHILMIYSNPRLVSDYSVRTGSYVSYTTPWFHPRPPSILNDDTRSPYLDRLHAACNSQLRVLCIKMDAAGKQDHSSAENGFSLSKST
jgi:hypothetical protein